MSKVIEVYSELIKFDDGFVLESYHRSECCEHHWLSFEDIKLEDFDDLEFDLSNDNFFKRIEGYGIELIPIKGFSIKVPGYGENNGYYSDNLDLVLSNGIVRKEWNITECQDYDPC